MSATRREAQSELPARLLATGAGATLNPAYSGRPGAAVGAGRTVDALTGRRSRVGRFIRQNQGNQGVQSPQRPSLRAAASHQDEQNSASGSSRHARLRPKRSEQVIRKGDPHDPIYYPNIRCSSNGHNNRRRYLGLSPLRRNRQLLRPAINSYNRMLELHKGNQVKASPRS